MAVFVITFLIIGIALIGMAIGIIAGRPAIKGSCGGLNQIGLNSDCACSNTERERCEKNNKSN